MMSQWTRDRIRAMHPWLPTYEVDRLVAELAPDNVEFDRPPPLVKIWPRRPPRVVAAWEHDQSAEGIAYRAARKEHMFLLRCEGQSLQQIGAQFAVGKQTVHVAATSMARRLNHAMRRTKFYWLADRP